MSKGLFVTFEGIDGAGKSLQIQMLEHYLLQEQIPHLVTREPAGTDIGTELAAILAHRDLDPIARALIFQADRAQHLADVIVPALERGLMVICDRYIDSSIVYQEVEGVSGMFLDFITGFVSKHILPDLTILLDLPIELARERSGDDTMGDDVYAKLRSKYLARARFFHHRIRVVDAIPMPWIVHNEVCQHLEYLRRNM